MIHLKREVEIKTFEVSGTIAVGEKRPEFLAVARLADDLNKPLDADTLLRELLGPVPKQAANLVMDRCLALGLLEGKRRSATLSDNGRQALEKEKILVPQEGEWRIWYVNDRLIDEAILHVERMPAEKNYGKQSQQAREKGTTLPRALEKLRYITSVSDGNIYKLEELAKVGQNGQPETLTMEILWTEGEAGPIVRLAGSLHNKKLDHSLTDLPKELGRWTYDKLWRNLALASNREKNLSEDELLKWAELGQKALFPMSFKETSPAERTTMRTQLTISSPELPEIGRFNNTGLNDVSLVPRSDEDADEWVEWQQWESLSDYQTPGTVKNNNERLMAKFPCHEVCPPDSDELLEIALNKVAESKSRFVLAPHDLGLWR
jgi:hypothetical protein